MKEMLFVPFDLFCIDTNSINLTCLTSSSPPFGLPTEIYNSKHTVLLVVNQQGEDGKKKRKKKLPTVKQPR